MKTKLLPSLTAAALALSACGQQNPPPSPPQSSAPVPAASAPADTPAASAAGASAPASASAPAAAAGKPGVDIRKDNLGGDFTLTDGTGKPFAMSSLKGKAVILSFGYTHCPDICPTELLTYKDTLAQLGEQAKDVAVVFVSVDPERDTPELIGQYVKQFHPDFIGLTDTQGGNDIALAKQLYKIISAKSEVKSEKLYNVDHSSGTYLLDKQGNAAIFEPFGAEAPQIAEDIRKLLAE